MVQHNAKRKASTVTLPVLAELQHQEAMFVCFFLFLRVKISGTLTALFSPPALLHCCKRDKILENQKAHCFNRKPANRRDPLPSQGLLQWLVFLNESSNHATDQLLLLPLQTVNGSSTRQREAS